MTVVRTSFDRSMARQRLAVLVAALGALLAAIYAAGPYLGALTTEWYADSRTLLGVPNFANVASNLAFLLAGATGLALYARLRRPAVSGHTLKHLLAAAAGATLLAGQWRGARPEVHVVAAFR
jgi:hypothetical protein